MKTRAIGVLDSGIGGLTVAREIIKLLLHENILYIGDRKNAPYGAHTKNEIYNMSWKMVEFLKCKNVKAIVVACNTITVNCLDDLRKEYPNIPIIGTVPVVKTVVEKTRIKRIGILSTTGTAGSAYQKSLIEKFAGDCFVVNTGTDELVPLIEKGEIESTDFRELLDRILKIFKDKEVDILALGCTHFPYLRKQIQEILGSKVLVLDSGEAIARQVKRVLENNNILNPNGKRKFEFYFTGHTEASYELIEDYFGYLLRNRIKYIDI